MDSIWAPWRITYIIAEKEEGCPLCVKDKKDSDRERLILERGDLSYVIMNKYPYINGHLMVAPYRHTGDFLDLKEEESKEIMDLIQLSVKILKEIMCPDGLNIGMNIGKVSGAGIKDHLHFHIVPRYNGDTNFLTVLSGIRVINEYLFDTYDKLIKGFKKYR